MKKLISSALLFCWALLSLQAQSPSPAQPALSPPPPMLEVVETIENRPLFPGCNETISKEKKRCSETKMLEFIYKGVNYPEKARKNRTEGTVYIKFYVEADGTLTHFEILKDIGDGCGEEALRVLQSMPNWEPATAQGKPIGNHFTLPVRFKL